MPSMQIIAYIQDADVIAKILTHLRAKAPEPEAPQRAPSRSAP
jgi:hypothetical protein